MPLVASLLAGCDSGGSSFKIKGTFRDMKSGNLYIYNKAEGTARFDTIAIKDGEFVYGGTAQETTPYILVFPNGVEQVIFVNGGEELHYEAAANDLKNYVVDGNDANKLMNQFRKETLKSSYKETQAIASRYIQKNPSSPVGIYLFKRYFIQDETITDKTTADILDTLKAYQPKNRNVMEIESGIKYLKRSTKGNTLPNLQLKTKQEKEISMRQTDTDWTLLVFWSTWMENCYEFKESLHREQDRYKDTDNLTIIAISLDTEIYKWENAIKNDTIGIAHCCDGRAWESSAVKQLGIGTLPCYILANRKHKIVAKGTTTSQLTKDLEKYIK